MTSRKFLIAGALIALAAPALANRVGPPTYPTSVPEPSDAGLFLLGAIGVIAGRRMHARRARAQRRQDLAGK